MTIFRKVSKKLCWFDYILLLLIIIQFGFIIFADFCLVPVTLDNDAAKSMVHAIEVYNSGTPFLKSWSVMTTLEISDPTILAVPFYGITRDIFSAYALANLVFLVLFMFLIYSLCNVLEVNLTGKLFSLVFLMTPFSFGQLLYFNMMFFSAGAYGGRVLLPLLLLVLLTDRKWPEWVHIIILAMTCGMCFLSGISTGIYAAISVLAPVVAAYVWLGIYKKELTLSNILCKRNIYCILSLTSFVAGYAVNKIKGGKIVGEELKMVSAADIWNSITANIPSYFEILGGVPSGNVTIVSLKGIMYVLRFVLAMLFLIAICIGISKSIKITFLSGDNSCENSDGEKIYDCQLLYSMYLFLLIDYLVIGIFSATSTQCRYLLLILIPMIPLFGKWITDVNASKKYDKIQHFLMDAILVGLMAVVVLLSDFQVVKADCYPALANDNAKYGVIIDKVHECNEKQVFFLNDTASPENIRCLDYDSDYVYMTYMACPTEWDGVGVKVHDYYVDITDASRMEQEHILIVNDELGSFDELPDYMATNYELIDEYQNFHMYKGFSNRFDGVTGYKDNDVSIDYCYSNDYDVLSGEIDSNGELKVVGSDQYVLNSPQLGYGETGEIEICMNYEPISKEGSLGRIEIYDAYGEGLIDSAEISGESDNVTLSGISLSGRNLAFKVWLNDGAQISIKNFVFTKK